MMDIKRELCIILAERRKERGFKYKDLTKKTGLKNSQLALIFCNYGHGISLHNVCVVAEAMGIEFELNEIATQDDYLG